jgi:hypothetical protein
MDGHYYVEAPAGKYQVRITATGFEDFSAVVLVSPGREGRLNAQLIRANMMAEPVVVRATRSGLRPEQVARLNQPLTPTPTALEKKLAPVTKVVDRAYFLTIWILILLSAFGLSKV